MGLEHEIRTDGDGNTKIVKSLTPIKAIRFNCLECVGWSFMEVELCTSPLCPLFPFRMGNIPGRKSNNPKGNPNLRRDVKNKSNQTSS